MIIVPLPHRERVEVDRDERYWRLTYALGDVYLRVRVLHVSDEDPDEFVFEVRLKEATNFIQVGACLVAPIEHSAAWDVPPDVDAFPDAWRSGFLMLARLWSELTEHAQMASQAHS